MDLRIVHWLTDPETASEYHTLFTTLRSAPDRVIDAGGSVAFDMSGGIAITRLWVSLPELRVHGTAPLYLKHGQLEQFVRAALSRRRFARTPLFVESEPICDFVQAWLRCYDEKPCDLAPPSKPVDDSTMYEAHLPADTPELAGLVHADVAPAAQGAGATLPEVIEELLRGPSPFVQVSVPVDFDTRSSQRDLRDWGFVVFGFDPSDRYGQPALLFGRATPGIPIVPTYWDNERQPHPYWDGDLSDFAAQVAITWNA